MKKSPDISLITSLIDDPACANILIALVSGKALTATELASETRITTQTTSALLTKLENTGLLKQHRQGRHHYFALASDDVADVLESIIGLAARRGLTRTRTGPKDEALRKARVCYNHLAGDLGVKLYDNLVQAGYLVENEDHMELSNSGIAFVGEFGIDLNQIPKNRRPLCKPCLDWSSRRSHLNGPLGAAFLNRFYELKWARRIEGSRVVQFSEKGEKAFLQAIIK